VTVAEAQTLLNTIMRGIDKKTALIVTLREDAERPGVSVRLTRDRRNATIEFTEVDLVAGQKDLMQRNRLRTALKRARDRMWEETGYIFSTRMEHHAPEGMQWFRPMQRGRGRR